MTDQATLAPLAPDRERRIDTWIDQLLRMHPEENSKYSPHMNPANITIGRLKEAFGKEVDLTPEELRSWCDKKNRDMPVGSI